MCNLSVPSVIVSGSVLLVVAVLCFLTGFVMASVFAGIIKAPDHDGWLGRLRDSHR